MYTYLKIINFTWISSSIKLIVNMIYILIPKSKGLTKYYKNLMGGFIILPIWSPFWILPPTFLMFGNFMLATVDFFPPTKFNF